MSYPDSEQQALIVKSLISSIKSAPFYMIAEERLVQKKDTIKVPLIDSTTKTYRQPIYFHATLFLNKDGGHYLDLSIAVARISLQDDKLDYDVKIPINWKLTKPEDNIITVCVALRDALYEYFRKTPLDQQPFLDEWNLVGEPIFPSTFGSAGTATTTTFTTETRTKIMKFLKVELARNKDWDRETVCDMQCEPMNFEGGLIARLDVFKNDSIEIKADIVIVQEFDDDIEAEVSLDVYYNIMFRNCKSPFIYWQEVISVKVGGICVDELLPYESGIDIFQRKLARVKELHLCKKCNENVNTYFLDTDGMCEDCYMAEP
jgi:hypothetical protein